MGIKQEPFVRYNVDKKADTFTVRLKPEERLKFNELKKALQQEKDSTALKQLAEIGAKVLLASQTKEILKVVLNNYRRNKRQGIVTFD